jgi:hypothetical protein
MALIKGKQIKGNSVALDRIELLTAQRVLITDGNGQLQEREVSGDATIGLTGALTVSPNAINAGKIADGSVTFAKLNAAAISSDLSVSAATTEVARADAAKAYADGRYTAATQYADSVAQGLDVKASVRAATTVEITLATDVDDGSIIDGVTLATGDRILVKDQTTDASENGIYIVAASGAPSRASDADQGDLTGGAFVFVEEGTANADNGFVCTTDGTPTLDTDDVSFAQFSGAGSVSPGAALSKTGNQLDVEVDGLTIEVNADALRVIAGGIDTNELADAGVTEAKLNASVAGNGLAGGAGSALSVDLNELTDDAIDLSADSIVFIDATDNGTKKESAADFAAALAGAGVTATNGQLTAARLSSTDQFETASATNADGDSSGVAISDTPEGMVQVFVNGMMQELKGDKTGDCYFSADGGTTARVLSAIAQNDILYWNGSVATFQLEADDKITLVYETA